MKLTMILLTVAFLHVRAEGVSQNVRFSGRRVPLKDVFDSVKKQTGYNFFYDMVLIDAAPSVTVDVNNMSLEYFLAKIFRSLPLKYSIQNKNVIVSRRNPKQADSSADHPAIITGDVRYSLAAIKGRVIDADGKPLIGATISIKNGKQSVLSDENGYFSLNVVSGDVLQVTYIGLERREVKITSAELNETGKTLIVQLKPVIATNDSVEVLANTGYQTVKPNEVNGSVVVITNKMLNEQVGTNILQRLQGITSSLTFEVGKNNTNPQSTTNITIRGLSTINGPLDPLIVLDQFIFEGDINNINPNDVESITILKDAAAASIWGARAGNGVIVIATKKAKFNQKLKIDFNSNVIVTEKMDLYKLSMLSSADYIDLEAFLFDKGAYNTDIDNAFRPGLTPAVELLLAKRNGQLSAESLAYKIDSLKQIDSRKEFNKVFYRNEVVQQYALTLKGGGNNISWLIGGTYDKTNGQLQSLNDKINLRVENSYKPFKGLSVTAGLYYTNNKLVSGASPFSSLISVNNRSLPYLAYTDAAGNALPVTKFNRYSFLDTLAGGKLLDWKYYPADDWKHAVTTTTTEQFLANIGLDYKITRDWNVGVYYQKQRQTGFDERHNDVKSWSTRDLINTFTQLDRQTSTLKYIVPLGDVLVNTYNNVNSNNLRLQTNFNKTWTKHSVSVLVGGEIREAITDRHGNAIYGYNEDPLYYKDVDFVNTYPTVITGFYNGIASNANMEKLVYRAVSQYGNFSYIYKSRYTLSGSIRKDGANVFGVHTNDKWTPLWSGGLGWLVSQESFYHSTLTPYLKLRLTYGKSGNVDISRSALPVAGYGVNSTSRLPFARINKLNNPELKWEQSAQLNIAVDFKIAKHILEGTIEAYNKIGTDLYGQTDYQYINWGASLNITQNIANMRSRGIDAVLQSRNIDRTFKWTTRYLYSFNKSITTKYNTTDARNGNSLLSISQAYDGGRIAPFVGYPLYSIAALKWGGLDAQGNPQGFLNGALSTDYTLINGESNTKGINSSSVVYFGSANPTSFGSIHNDFSWKNLSLAINVSYKFGYYFFKDALDYSSLIVNGSSGHSEYADRWKKPGDELSTDVPSFIYPNIPARDNFYYRSEIHVLKGDHIRLQYINLQYSIVPKKTNSSFSQVQLYFNASNLGILWRANNKGLDPDYPSGYIPGRRWALGLRASL